MLKALSLSLKQKRQLPQPPAIVSRKRKTKKKVNK